MIEETCGNYCAAFTFGYSDDDPESETQYCGKEFRFSINGSTVTRTAEYTSYDLTGTAHSTGKPFAIWTGAGFLVSRTGYNLYYNNTRRKARTDSYYDGFQGIAAGQSNVAYYIESYVQGQSIWQTGYYYSNKVGTGMTRVSASTIGYMKPQFSDGDYYYYSYSAYLYRFKANSTSPTRMPNFPGGTIRFMDTSGTYQSY